MNVTFSFGDDEFLLVSHRLLVCEMHEERFFELKQKNFTWASEKKGRTDSFGLGTTAPVVAPIKRSKMEPKMLLKKFNDLPTMIIPPSRNINVNGRYFFNIFFLEFFHPRSRWDSKNFYCYNPLQTFYSWYINSKFVLMSDLTEFLPSKPTFMDKVVENPMKYEVGWRD